MTRLRPSRLQTPTCPNRPSHRAGYGHLRTTSVETDRLRPSLEWLAGTRASPAVTNEGCGRDTGARIGKALEGHSRAAGHKPLTPALRISQSPAPRGTLPQPWLVCTWALAHGDRASCVGSSAVPGAVQGWSVQPCRAVRSPLATARARAARVCTTPRTDGRRNDLGSRRPDGRFVTEPPTGRLFCRTRRCTPTAYGLLRWLPAYARSQTRIAASRRPVTALRPARSPLADAHGSRARRTAPSPDRLDA